MSRLKYSIGQERDIVLENTNYEESVFHDQYARGIRILDSYFQDIEKDGSLKTIAVCGGRGDGKTSCMQTMLGIFDSMKRKDSEAYRFVISQGCEKLTEKKLKILDLIDPSFFDDDHNVLEIIIGHIYNSYKKFLDANFAENLDHELKNILSNCFQEVKRSLNAMRGGKVDGLNDLMDLSLLSSSITLREQIKNLVEKYLKFVNADCLIVPIDDIDLNMEHAYMMCEQIRKYLPVPRCIVAINVKIDQLEKVVNIAFRSSVKHSNLLSKHESYEMSERYLNKLLSVSSRIDMPKPYELPNIEIVINDGHLDIIKGDKLKMALVQLIFYRTRYLFYNPMVGSSPIVPNNMRDIFNFVGLLASMKSPYDKGELDKSILSQNKRLFKSYFFTVWISQFESKLKDSLNKLVDFDFGTSFNREVIAILNSRFSSLLKKDYREEDSDQDSKEDAKSVDLKNVVSEMVASIVSKDNFGYNISIGDVFCFISYLESETLEEIDYALIFFLKSLYSIKMYEAYDDVTETAGRIYPSGDDSIKGLTTIDRRFDHINELQKLTGGSFFTYYPGELLPKSKEGTYDLRIIKSNDLFDLIAEVSRDFEAILSLDPIDPSNIARINEFDEKLNLMEFFILTISMSIPQKRTTIEGDEITKIIRSLEYARKNVKPMHYSNFGVTTGFFLFDILAPFANILNPRFAYTRFEQINDALYEKILNYGGSLLSKMMKVSGQHRLHINYPSGRTEEEIEKNKQRMRMHRLLSDASIRNAEVLMSVKSNIANYRRIKHRGWREALTEFYSEIQKSGLKILKHFPGEDDVYEITFQFLGPIQNILKKALDEKDHHDLNENFLKIINSFTQSTPEEGDVERAIVYNGRNIYPDQLYERLGKTQNVKAIRDKILASTEFSGITKTTLKTILPGGKGVKMHHEEVFAKLKEYFNTEANPTTTNQEQPEEPPIESSSSETTPNPFDFGTY